MVGTDRSETAERAVGWAAAFAERYGAELHIVQIVIPTDARRHRVRRRRRHARPARAADDLQTYATTVAGDRGRAHVVIDDDPAMAIVQATEDHAIDVLVVGNAGMAGRKEFLLGNVPNRISHNARCTVIIVNTTDGAATAVARAGRRGADQVVARRDRHRAAADGARARRSPRSSPSTA